MRTAFLTLVLAGMAAAAPSQSPGLKIVARETSPGSVVETIEYIEIERARVDSRVTPAPLRESGMPAGEVPQGHRTGWITRCDLRKSILLNHDDRTYVAGPLPTYPGASEKLLAPVASGETAEAKSPTLLIETTTVQTGERRSAFGQSARRVITTRRDIPLDAAGGAETTVETDGWYIDLDTRPSCERIAPNGVRTVLLVSKASADGVRAPELPTVTFKDIGLPERGYAIEMRTTSRHRMASADGTSSEHAMVTHKIVTQLSREPLDPALFEIPADFRAADGHLAAFLAQWSSAWQRIKAVVGAFFR